MKFERLHFGSFVIDSVTYSHDVLIDRGKVLKRKKQPSSRVPLRARPLRASAIGTRICCSPGTCDLSFV